MSWQPTCLVRYNNAFERNYTNNLFEFRPSRISQSLLLSCSILFQNTANESLEMTTPVYTRKAQSDSEKMEMTTPVITKQVCLLFISWDLSFVSALSVPISCIMIRLVGIAEVLRVAT